MRAPWLLPVLLAACAGEPPLVAVPASLDFGEVDFQSERPPDGYAAIDLQLRNEGRRDLDLVIEGFPAERLRLSGQISGDPPALPTLAADQATVVTVGVEAYELGERDTEVTGSFRITGDGLPEPLAIPWSYVPIRDFGTDTAR